MCKRISFSLLASLAILFIFSCGDGTSEQAVVAEDTTSVAFNDTAGLAELTQFKYDKLISNIPIPFDILRAHAEVPLKYNPKAVNPISNLSSYSTNFFKALNLGIYGGDLAYSITYEKFDDMGEYLKCVKKLADDLGIPLAFDQNVLSTYKKYSTNKDSLEKMVFNSYSTVDKTLKSNERIGLAALVVAGGWLEGLYATLKTLDATPRTDKSQGVYNKIWEQKNHLDMIIGLLEQFKEDKLFIPLIKDFKKIKSVYDGLTVKSAINETEVASLLQHVEELRNKIAAR